MSSDRKPLRMAHRCIYKGCSPLSIAYSSKLTQIARFTDLYLIGSTREVGGEKGGKAPRMPIVSGSNRRFYGRNFGVIFLGVAVIVPGCFAVQQKKEEKNGT